MKYLIVVFEQIPLSDKENLYPMKLIDDIIIKTKRKVSNGKKDSVKDIKPIVDD